MLEATTAPEQHLISEEQRVESYCSAAYYAKREDIDFLNQASATKRLFPLALRIVAYQNDERFRQAAYQVERVSEQSVNEEDDEQKIRTSAVSAVHEFDTALRAFYHRQQPGRIMRIQRKLAILQQRYGSERLTEALCATLSAFSRCVFGFSDTVAQNKNNRAYKGNLWSAAQEGAGVGFIGVGMVGCLPGLIILFANTSLFLSFGVAYLSALAVGGCVGAAVNTFFTWRRNKTLDAIDQFIQQEQYVPVVGNKVTAGIRAPAVVSTLRGDAEKAEVQRFTKTLPTKPVVTKEAEGRRNPFTEMKHLCG